MIRIARDPYLFSFLWLCRPVATITLGDARLTLADAPDGAYDLIVVDAFSSDAIPIHLMTREAMAMYKAKLAPHGMLVMHISNRHLELASVVAGIAAANGLITYIDDSTDIDEAANPYKYSGTVAAVARSEEDFGMLAQSRDWEPKTPDPAQWVWTDDYSNIVGAVLRKLKE
jgi:spermidine synthase